MSYPTGSTYSKRILYSTNPVFSIYLSIDGDSGLTRNWLETVEIDLPGAGWDLAGDS